MPGMSNGYSNGASFGNGNNLSTGGSYDGHGGETTLPSIYIRLLAAASRL